MSATATPTVKLSAEFGFAPVGAETRSWDWAEDEYGYKTRYEFDIIPDEAVTVTSVWADHSDRVDSVLADLARNSDPCVVIRLTISVPEKNSFFCGTWMRFDEAFELVTNFLESVK